MFRNIVLLLFLAVFGGVGGWQMIVGVGSIATAWESAGWPSVSGTVLSAEVIKSSSGRNGTSYTPKISYSYQVNGDNLTGTIIAPGRSWSSSSANNAVQRFAVGTHPAISYAPTDPSRAVLEPGLRAASFGRFMTGCIFFSFAGIVGLVLYDIQFCGKNESGGTIAMDNKRPTVRAVPIVIVLIFVEFLVAICLSN